MKRLQTEVRTPRKSLFFRLCIMLGYGAVFASIVAVAFLVLQAKHLVETTALNTDAIPPPVITQIQFPVGVDVAEKEIVENPEVDSFFDTHVSVGTEVSKSHTGWLPRVLGKLALMDWYQNLASLSSRILVIQSGERKEEVAQHFGKILGWTNEQKKEFLSQIESSEPMITEGKLFPGTYTVAKGALPSDVSPLVLDKFATEVVSRYGKDVEAQVPLEDALIVASLLEREAYDFEDMRHISGVIWNRLFTDMKLQIDASLQYAKGSKSEQPWWPRVVPADKYIPSEFNTYKIPGLPPSAIANPSLDAILAALNPKKTDCMFYFHDKNAGFHCTKTYEEHVSLLKQYYGRGK